MVIKSIPAKYGGIEYRSRTEARWAVFFDLINVDFEYEKEGYQTKQGWYVPDFWLPQSECWIEIKGTTDGHEDHVSLLGEVCDETKTFGFVFVGSPKDMNGTFIGMDSAESSAGHTGSWLDSGIARAGKHQSIVFMVDIGERQFYCREDWIKDIGESVWAGDYRDEWDEFGVKEAAIQASKYRFW